MKTHFLFHLVVSYHVGHAQLSLRNASLATIQNGCLKINIALIQRHAWHNAKMMSTAKIQQVCRLANVRLVHLNVRHAPAGLPANNVSKATICSKIVVEASALRLFMKIQRPMNV